MPVHVPRTDTNTETMSNKSKCYIFQLFHAFVGKQNLFKTSDKDSRFLWELEKRKIEKPRGRLKCKAKSY